MASALKNTSSLVVAHLIARLLSLGLLIFLPHYFKDTQLGVYLWSASVTNIMAICIVFGMHVPLIRELAVYREKAPHHLGNALVIRILLSVVALALLLAGVRLFGRSQETLVFVALLGLAEVLNTLAMLFRCAFRAYEEMHYEAVIVLLERLSVFLVGGGMVALGYSLTIFCAVIVGAGMLNLILSLGIMLRRFTSISLKIDLAFWRELLVQSFPFALGGIFNIIYFRIDAVMLPKLCRTVDGWAAVTWYGLAYSLVTSLTIVPGAFTNAIFPVLSRLYRNSPRGFRRLYTDSLRLMFLLALPIAVGLTLLSGQITAFVWDVQEYPPGTIDAALSLLSWAGSLLFLNAVIGIVLRATDRRAAFASLIGGAMVVNILLNVLLVPYLNHRGAALAMVLTEVGMFLAGFIYISRTIVSPDAWGFLPKSILMSGTMGAGLWALRQHLPVWVLTPLASFLYFGGMIAWKELRLKSFMASQWDGME